MDLHLNALTALPTKGDILNALNNINKGSNPLDTVYELIIKKIKNQSNGITRLAKKILLWIMYTKKLMSSTEIQQALNIRLNTRAVNTNYYLNIKQIMLICAKLVIVDEKAILSV